MYTIDASIRGTAGLLQHAFGAGQLGEIQKAAKVETVKRDYSLEWMDTMYRCPDGLLGQPASHIEGAMVKAATSFIRKSKKTYKDSIKAYLYVQPDMIPHIRDGEYVTAPDASLIQHPTETLSVSIMRVVVQRSAVARSRLLIASGWELAFQMQVVDDQLDPDVIKSILTEAGISVGIGDYRPRFGRFSVTSFVANKH